MASLIRDHAFLSQLVAMPISVEQAPLYFAIFVTLSPLMMQQAVKGPAWSAQPTLGHRLPIHNFATSQRIVYAASSQSPLFYENMLDINSWWLAHAANFFLRHGSIGLQSDFGRALRELRETQRPQVWPSQLKTSASRPVDWLDRSTVELMPQDFGSHWRGSYGKSPIARHFRTAPDDSQHISRQQSSTAFALLSMTLPLLTTGRTKTTARTPTSLIST